MTEDTAPKEGDKSIIEVKLPDFKESGLNKFCRENKDLLNVGSRIGIYLALMMLVFLYTKTAVMQQVQWAEDHCECQEWGGDVFTLQTQQKIDSNISGLPYLTGVDYVGTTTGG